MDKPRMRQRRHKHIRPRTHPGQRVNNCHGFPGPINAQLLTRGMGQKRSQVVDIDVVFKQRAELPVGIMLLARSGLTAGVFMVFHLQRHPLTASAPGGDACEIRFHERI